MKSLSIFITFIFICNTLLLAQQKQGCIYGNCKNGEGIYRFESGNIYEGPFVNGKQHGYGKHSDQNGTVTAGFWVNGVRDGAFASIDNDDRSFFCIYSNGKKHGYSHISDKNGNIISEQEWDHGKLIRNTANNKKFLASSTAPVVEKYTPNKKKIRSEQVIKKISQPDLTKKEIKNSRKRSAYTECNLVKIEKSTLEVLNNEFIFDLLVSCDQNEARYHLILEKTAESKAFYFIKADRENSMKGIIFELVYFNNSNRLFSSGKYGGQYDIDNVTFEEAFKIAGDLFIEYLRSGVWSEYKKDI